MNSRSPPPYIDIEAVSNWGTNKIAVSDMLIALDYRRNDMDLQSWLCSMFSTFDTRDLDFYLPQLWFVVLSRKLTSSQILIDRGQQAEYLRRALLELCRRYLRTGVLSYFYFSAAVEDNLTGNISFCKQMTEAIKIAAISGKSQELSHLMQRFKVTSFSL